MTAAIINSNRGRLQRVATQPTIDIASVLAGLPAFPQLQGKRVRLRGPRSEDADALFQLFADPQVMRYWSRPPMTTRMEAEGLLEEIHESFKLCTKLNWMLTLRCNDAVIGTCTLFQLEPRHRRAEVGYALRSDHWGRGLATEAATLALDWAFRVLGLHRIEADIDPRNESSRKLLQRLGFSSEGVLRERYFVGEEISDTELFGLLEGDWTKRSL
jgi:ribosomal-protein-alanine N-acetyltransferase